MAEDPGPPEEQRNVVFIVCDQLRRSALGYAGDPNVETPNLDQLAESGTRCTNASVTFPVCVPSRFTMMTGRSAHERLVPAFGWRMSPRERTLADAFAESGHETAYVGKWHLFHRLPSDGPKRANRLPIPEGYRGRFDHWRGFEIRNNPYDTAYFADDDPEPRMIEGHQTDGLTDLAIEYVQDAGDPFFLSLQYEAPHWPFTAPPEYHDRWEDRTLELPDPLEDRLNGPPPNAYGRWGSVDGTDSLGRHLNWRRNALLDDLRGYYAMIEHVDANVGRLLDALDEAGRRENTTIVFTSDHGEHLGLNGRVGKNSPLEPSVGVPFLVAGAGIEDRTVSDPIRTEDWFPTLVELGGGTPDGTLPGDSIAPLAWGESDGLDRPGVPLENVWDHRGGEPWRAFRSEQYTYVVRDGQPAELYDLEADPYQQENVVRDSEYRDAASRLHRHLRDHLASSVDTYELETALGHEGVNQVTGP
jgi:arylsulfatase A-like enzyme